MATVLSLQYNGGTAFNTAVSWLFPCSILFFSVCPANPFGNALFALVCLTLWRCESVEEREKGCKRIEWVPFF